MNKLLTRIKLLRNYRVFSNFAEIILAKLLSKRVITYRFNGFHVVSIREYGDDNGILDCLQQGVYDQAIEKSVGSRSKRTYLNIGANVGAFDIIMQQKWGSRLSGVAIEMNPFTYSRLCVNIYLNKISTSPVNAAVSNVQGTIPVSIGKSGTGQSMFNTTEHDFDLVEVPTYPLHYFVDKYFNNEAIDLLEVDCEGAEYLIFEQVTPEDLAPIRNIVVEVHPSPVKDFDEKALVNMIAGKGSYKAEFHSDQDKLPFIVYFTREREMK